jgi:hypothetical protein
VRKKTDTIDPLSTQACGGFHDGSSLVFHASGGSTSRSLDPIDGVGKLTRSKINLINRNKTACKWHLLALNKPLL